MSVREQLQSLRAFCQGMHESETDEGSRVWALDVDALDVAIEAIPSQTESEEGCECCRGEALLLRCDDVCVYIVNDPRVGHYQLVLGSVEHGGWIVGKEIFECPICRCRLGAIRK